MIRRVHVVFKTHLDLGFTGYSSDVLDDYLDLYIPKALDLAESLQSDDRAGFVWTTGSWLIAKALERADPVRLARLEEAIAEGRIVWHALPCSTHTELMDGALVRYALSISRRLDDRFGIRTTAAKMTDVPGHTIGLVPHLSEAGVRFLHLGVNPASAVPEVPELFVWRAPDSSEVVVLYQGDYGSTASGRAVTHPGLEDALYLAHTNDNHGPPSRSEVIALFDRLRAEYPDAEIVASTLDAFGAAVESARGDLPVVEDEIGDTWIHGPAADPPLLSGLRTLMRVRDDLLAQGRLAVGSSAYDRFSDNLLLVAEHTWGEDQKAFLPDYRNYDRYDFEQARAAQTIDLEGVPAEFASSSEFVSASSQPRTYAAYEKSWHDKRAYLEAAVAALPEAEQEVARRALAVSAAAVSAAAVSAAAVSATSGARGESARVDAEHDLGAYRVRFDETGAISSLVDAAGTTHFDPDHVFGRLSFETFDADDQDRWVSEYCRDLDLNAAWALPDQTRLGLREFASSARRTLSTGTVLSLDIARDEEADAATLRVVLPEHIALDFGAPSQFQVSYRFSRSAPRIDMTVTTIGRRASRLPQATWFSCRPARSGRWLLDKMGTTIDPSRVVRGGNRRLHATGSLRHEAASGAVVFHTLDAPVVALGEHSLFRFDGTLPASTDGVEVILHDNAWPTNFRQWFAEDLSYRFSLDTESIEQ